MKLFIKIITFCSLLLTTTGVVANLRRAIETVQQRGQEVLRRAFQHIDAELLKLRDRVRVIEKTAAELRSDVHRGRDLNDAFLDISDLTNEANSLADAIKSKWTELSLPPLCGLIPNLRPMPPADWMKTEWHPGLARYPAETRVRIAMLLISYEKLIKELIKIFKKEFGTKLNPDRLALCNARKSPVLPPPGKRACTEVDERWGPLAVIAECYRTGFTSQ
jgi:hypothetical protein